LLLENKTALGCARADGILLIIDFTAPGTRRIDPQYFPLLPV
jgi:hypothetical protein